MFQSIHRLFAAGLICTAGLAFTSQAQAVTADIDTIPSWDHTSGIGVFGEPAAATWGQTFTVDSPSSLTSVSLYVYGFDNEPQFTDFAIYIAQWDDVNNHITGPVLAQSAQYTATNSFQQFTFNTGGLNLGIGSYIAYVSASAFYDNINDGSVVGINDGDAYAGGTFFMLDNGSDTSAWSSSEWLNFFDADLAFIATFAPQQTAVPEPASVALLGLAAVAGAAAITRRRRA